MNRIKENGLEEKKYLLNFALFLFQIIKLVDNKDVLLLAFARARGIALIGKLDC